jgi:hypothetical protein
MEAYFSHQALNSRAAVVMRDVAVEIFPVPLDAIVIGAVAAQRASESIVSEQ